MGKIHSRSATDRPPAAPSKARIGRDRPKTRAPHRPRIGQGSTIDRPQIDPSPLISTSAHSKATTPLAACVCQAAWPGCCRLERAAVWQRILLRWPWSNAFARPPRLRRVCQSLSEGTREHDGKDGRKVMRRVSGNAWPRMTIVPAIALETMRERRKCDAADEEVPQYVSGQNPRSGQ